MMSLLSWSQFIEKETEMRFREMRGCQGSHGYLASALRMQFTHFDF